MAWVATGAAAIGAAGSIYAGSQAAKSAGNAADTAAQAEQNKLSYLMDRDAGANFYRDQAMNELGQFYGLGSYQGEGQGRDKEAYDSLMDQKHEMERTIHAKEVRGKHTWWYKGELERLDMDLERLGYDPSAQQSQTQGRQSGQQGLIDDVQASPFYDLMISQGEEAIGRNAAMTGGLRSGTANENLAQNSQNVLQGMVGDRLRGLTGMSQLPSNANAIGSSMSQIGNIQSQGQVAGAQATQQGWQGAMTGMGQAAGAYLGRPPMNPQNPTYGYGVGAGSQPIYGGGYNPMPEDYGSYV